MTTSYNIWQSMGRMDLTYCNSRTSFPSCLQWKYFIDVCSVCTGCTLLCKHLKCFHILHQYHRKIDLEHRELQNLPEISWFLANFAVYLAQDLWSADSFQQICIQCRLQSSLTFFIARNFSIQRACLPCCKGFAAAPISKCKKLGAKREVKNFVFCFSSVTLIL